MKPIHFTLKRYWLFALCLAIFLFLLLEVGLRAVGFLDFPTYELHNSIGYLPRASQEGAFLRKNRWHFNDRHMPIARNWTSSEPLDILLIGNSIVMGGNPYDQSEKLSPILESFLGPGGRIWPCATGGWTNLNQIAYLEANSDIASAADFVVWEYMQGGLSQLARWRSEVPFPTEYPNLASSLFIRKYILPRIIPPLSTSELPPTGLVPNENLRRFDSALATFKKRSRDSARAGIVWLYPKQQELIFARAGKEWLPERDSILSVAKRNGFVVIDIAANHEWEAHHYRDGVHPTVAGNTVLAKILAQKVAQLIQNR